MPSSIIYKRGVVACVSSVEWGGVKGQERSMKAALMKEEPTGSHWPNHIPGDVI